MAAVTDDEIKFWTEFSKEVRTGLTVEVLMGFLRDERQAKKKLDDKVLELNEKCRVQEQIINEIQDLLQNKATSNRMSTQRVDHKFEYIDDVINDKVESYDFVG